MGEQKRFKKQKVNRDADKRMEQGAKIVKGGVGALGTIALLFANKDKVKGLAQNVIRVAGALIKK